MSLKEKTLSLLNAITFGKVGVVCGAIDPSYDEAAKLVIKSGNTSIAHLQRHLRLGYGRACRLMAALIAAGLVHKIAEGDYRVDRK